jgi:hypothetical protein
MRFFSKSPAESREARFWRWFRDHEDGLFAFERDQKATLGALAKALDAVHPDLTYEIGPTMDGARELVLSAGGIRKAFPAVVALADAAPPLPRWRVTKFRPRRSVISDLNFGTMSLRSAQIAVAAERDGDRVALGVFIEGFALTKEHHYEQMAYLMLDEALGEYDMETKVGAVEFFALREPRDASLRPLEELGGVVDRLLAA